MIRESGIFERQIERIHRLVEQPGSIISWNDHIADPDNICQMRQIDITIRRGQTLTIIECRIHKNRQDVKWIEEIVGRRLSLRAEAAIAVSASGFTKGAVAKAKRFGVILRDTQTLTEEEIVQWGHSTRVWLTYHHYKDVNITLLFDRNRKFLTQSQVIEEMQKRGRMYYLVQKVAEEIDARNPKGKNCEISAELTTFSFEVKGNVIKKAVFRANVEYIGKSFDTPSVVAYDCPGVPTLNRDVFLEQVDFGTFEISQSSNDVHVVFDISLVENPPNSLFRYATFDFKRTVRMHGLELIGEPKFQLPLTFTLETGAI